MSIANAGLEDIFALAKEINSLNDEAYYAYRGSVETLCQNEETTENEVELMLDYLLSFCGGEKVLELYKKVCRTFYYKYPAVISDYINMYREVYDSDEQD